MFNQNGGYSLADIAAATRGGEDGGFFGNGSWWVIIFLVMFCGWGGFGGGWGNNGGGAQGALTRSDLTYSFDMSNLDRSVDGIASRLCDNNATTLSAMSQGFAGLNTAITNNGYAFQNALQNQTMGNMQNTYAITDRLNAMQAAADKCCCENERLVQSSFADLNYNLATQACATKQAIDNGVRDILENNNEGIRSILNFLTQDKIATLQAENQSLKSASSQANQNAYLLNHLRPTPIPAYVVDNPYTSPYYAAMANGFAVV